MISLDQTLNVNHSQNGHVYKNDMLNDAESGPESTPCS